MPLVEVQEAKPPGRGPGRKPRARVASLRRVPQKRGMRFLPLPTRLDRYIFRQLFWALIAVTAGLTALIWLTQSLRFVELVVNRGLSLLVFMRLTGLLIPSFIAVILPITTYVVIQFIYQRLAGDREVTVMRAAGLSPFALARPALAVALVATVAGYWLNLSVVPEHARVIPRVSVGNPQQGRGVPVAGRRVHLDFRQVGRLCSHRARRTGRCTASWSTTPRDPTVHATILAESGQLMEGNNGPRVLLMNGSRQEIDHQTGRLNMLTFSRERTRSRRRLRTRRRTAGGYVGSRPQGPVAPTPRVAARRAEMDRRGA